MNRENTNRLLDARTAAGLTQQQVADALGATVTGYQNWEYGKTPVKASILRMLARLFNCTTDYLLGIDDSPSIIRAVPTESRMVPVVGRVAAGEAREAIEQRDRLHPVPSGALDGRANVVWVEVSGNSMNRLFPDGALVLIDRDAAVRDGDVAAVFVNGDDITIKRVYFEVGAVRLHPESYDPEYRDRVIDASDPDAPDVHVFGKAVSYTAPDGWRA